MFSKELSWASIVCQLPGYGLDNKGNVVRLPAAIRDFFFYKVSRRSLVPTQPAIQRVSVFLPSLDEKRKRCEADSSLPSDSEIKNAWSSTLKCTIYLLTPCSRVLLEKITGLQLVKKFPAFYGTRMFIIAFTSARHLSLS